MPPDTDSLERSRPPPIAEEPGAERRRAERDLVMAGQRRINLIWEYTQAVIALLVVFTTMGAGLYGMVHDLPIPTLMAVAFGTVVGFYFSRTNHSAIGGVGVKALPGPYVGR